MRLYKLILFGFFITTKIVNAQTDFRPGYIVKNSGDTIFGKIEYRSDLLMGQICKFKNSDNKIVKYSPYDITEYRLIDSKYYISKEIDSKKVFLEYLLKGKINIYFHFDDKGEHYYLDKENIRLTEIPYEEEIKIVDNKSYQYSSTRHLGILHYYMEDAPSVLNEINSIKKPDSQNLIKLAENYHNAVCSDEKCIIYRTKKSKTKVLIEPFMSRLKYDDYNKFTNELGTNIYLSISKNYYIKTGLSYLNIPDSFNGYYYKVPLQLQYIYSAHRVQPKLALGNDICSGEYADEKEILAFGSLNTGLNFQLTKRLGLSSNFNLEYTPIMYTLVNSNYDFELFSHAFCFGVVYEL